jgi:hypothetical protein
MKNSHYLSDLQHSIFLLESSNASGAAIALQKFYNWLNTSTKARILLTDLLAPSLSTPPLTLIDIDHIVRHNYLIPHRHSQAQQSLYSLSHPKIGEILHTCSVMCDTVRDAIRRKKYKEIREEELSRFEGRAEGKNKFRKIPAGSAPEGSGLGWKYHLYDLIGSGVIERVETGGLQGAMLRIKKS